MFITWSKGNIKVKRHQFSNLFPKKKDLGKNLGQTIVKKIQKKKKKMIRAIITKKNWHTFFSVKNKFIQSIYACILADNNNAKKTGHLGKTLKIKNRSGDLEKFIKRKPLN